MADGNMPSPPDDDINVVLESVGIRPGIKLNWKKLSPKQKKTLNDGVKEGKALIAEDIKTL